MVAVHPSRGRGDGEPRAVATLLDGMVQRHLGHDHELAAILAGARDKLRALSSNRYAARLHRECAQLRLERRHKRRERHVLVAAARRRRRNRGW